MLLVILLVVLLPIDVISKITITVPATNRTNSDYRISNKTIPHKYLIALDFPKESIEENTTSFNGFVKITFEVLKPTYVLFINSKIDVTNISLTDANNQSFPLLSWNYNKTTEVLMINIPFSLYVQSIYTLEIFYIGRIRDSIMGVFKSGYTIKGVKEYMIATQFEPTYARYAFPCFDEPLLKASYMMTLTYPKEYSALSNTREYRTTENNGTKTTTFEETPRMSTYLNAFSISKFTCSNSFGVYDNISFGVCSQNDLLYTRNLALDYGVKFLNAMSDYTNFNYSNGNKKMDLIGVPGFFESAMENWGLITFSENYLLYDAAHTSIEWKQYVLETVAHELIHQWFGNLVTTKWWNSLFLNEGMTTYFSYYIFTLIKELRPFEMDKQFVLQQQQAFVEDDSNDSESVTADVEDIDDINDKFSTITYNKGGCIIRMISLLIGEANFQEGIRLYIKNNKYNSSTPDYLWNAISPFIKKGILPENLTLSQFIGNWINQPSFPIVNVTADGDDVILTQKCILKADGIYDNTCDTQWYVPVNYLSSNNGTGLVWLEPNKSVTLNDVISNSGWIIVNHKSKGYFRVNYDSTLQERLSSILQSNLSQIEEIDRSQIIDDTFNLALIEVLKYHEIFDMIKFLKNDSSFYSWDAAVRGLNSITDKLSYKSETFKCINNLTLELIEDISLNVPKTNWAGVSPVEGIKLPLVWGAACKAGQKQCIEVTNKMFEDFRDRNISIDPNLRRVVYCNILRYSNDNDTHKNWNFLWDRYHNVENTYEKLYIMLSLGCTLNKNDLQFYLGQTINSTSGFSQLDFDTIWTAVYSSSYVGTNAAFDYFIDNYSEILKYFDNASSTFANLIANLASKSRVRKLNSFKKSLDKDNQRLKDIIEANLSTAKNNLDLQRRIERELEEFCKNNRTFNSL